MPVPKRKRSKARRDKRFANKGIKELAFSACLQCQKPVQPHAACHGCGFYKGTKVFATKDERTGKRTEARKHLAKDAAAPADTNQE